MKIDSKFDLMHFVNIVISDKTINDAKTLQKIREKTEEYILSKGDIFPNSFLELFENFQNTKIKKDEKITKHIKFFTEYYKDASIEEKFILNNLIFGLEILNGNAKEGLKNFIKRTFEFNLHANMNNEYLMFDIKFISNVKTDDSLLIKTVKDLITPENFLNQNPLTKRAYFVNFLSLLWNNPVMTNNKIWLEIFDDLIVLLNECKKLNLIEEYMYIHFFTYHIYGNNIQTLKECGKFNEKVEIPASKFYKQWGEKHNLIKPKKRISAKKKKIGFILDRIVMNSPWMVMYSLWKSILKNDEFKKNYEIYIYSMNYLDKQPEDGKLISKIQNLGIKFYSPQNEFINYGFYYPHLEKTHRIREKIIEDKIDYLILTTSGYDIGNFIFSNRSAPRQIYWSHGNCTSEIENIDKRISHFPQECKEFEWKIFNVPMEKEFLTGSKEEKEAALLIKKELLKQFGKETIFLGTIGRLVKIESEEYLKVLAEIMKQNPNTVYLACGDGNRENIEKLMQKVGIELNRVIFTGQVNPHIFGWIIDVWPDSFPLLQGHSRNEFELKGGAILGMKKYYPEVFINSLKSVTNKKVLAEDEKEYIELANKLIQNKNYRKEIGENFKKRMTLVNRSDVNEFLDILR